jgi:hypothetical protein
MDTLLKKDFVARDVERIRNIVKKDYSAKTRIGVGYDVSNATKAEGDIWEEGGKTWTIKNGLKQSITKLDSAKKALQTPLACPKCGGPMKHHLAKKMYKIHGFCFDPCTVDYEANLRKLGLYEQYEKRMVQGNMRAFTQDIEHWLKDHIQSSNTFVTEQGDVEEWKSNSDRDSQAVKNVEELLTQMKKYLD